MNHAAWADKLQGVNVAFESAFIDGLWVKYVCMLCERECYLTAASKEFPKGEWVHCHSDGPWCPRDKRHGPKTRRCHPLPGLIVINEMEEP